MEKEIRDIVIDYKNNLVTSPPFNVLRSSAKTWRATSGGLCTGRSHRTAAFGACGRCLLHLYIYIYKKKNPTLKVWLYMGQRIGKERRCLTRKIRSNTGVGVKQLVFEGGGGEGRVICKYRVILLKRGRAGAEASRCRWSVSE